MTTALFFPANKLAAEVCRVFNDHVAVVCQNTDRLKDGQYAAAELGLFKHNIQGTSFLNPVAVSAGENQNYQQTLLDVSGSGRISFGLYYRTDYWRSPATGATEPIPDFNATAWTSAGAAVFSGAVVGAAKAARYPNHGQQMYDISNGALGYDVATQKYGASGGSETILHTRQQLDYFRDLAGLNLSVGSHAVGRDNGALLHIPYLLGMRNSAYSYTGSGDVRYSGMSRLDLMSRASTTRSWDAIQAGQSTQEQALAYVQSQVQAAIAAGGQYSDFMHWHSLYDFNDTDYFDPFYSVINTAIGASDVWRAGNSEATEYYFLRDAIDKIGSFVDGASVYLAFRFKDGYATTNSTGIPNTLPVDRIQTPLSLRVDLTGTPLAGLNIVCDQAASIRKKTGNVWVLNVRPTEFKDGYYLARIRPGSGSYYDATVPTLSVSENTVSADRLCKFVVWRKPIAGTEKDIAVVSRTTGYSTSVPVVRTSGYDYYIGGITQSRMSSVLQIGG